MKRVKNLNELSRDNGNIAIVLRFEELLASNTIEFLIKKLDEIYLYYYDCFLCRLGNLYEQQNELCDPMEDKELAEYLENLKLTTIERDNATDEQKLKLFNLYSEGISKNYGPEELMLKRGFYEESYQLDEFLNDKDIFHIVQERLPDVIKKPERIAIGETIERVEQYFSTICSVFTTAPRFAINREILFEHFDKVDKILSEFDEKGLLIELTIDDDGQKVKENTPSSTVPYSYVSSDLKKLQKLANHKSIMGLYFSEFYQEDFIPYCKSDLWTFDDIYYANAEKIKIAEMVKKANLTPLEQQLFINSKIGVSEYTGTANNDEKTRTFLTFIAARDKTKQKEITSQGKSFVCSGFAASAKAVVDEIGSERLKCTIIPMTYYNKDSSRKRFGSTHVVDLVYIKDENYDLDGYAIWDPTWSVDSLDFVLVPITDLKKYAKYFINIDHKNKNSITTYLYTPRKDSCDERAAKNTVFDDYADKTIVVSAETIKTALKTAIEKVEAAGFDVSDIMRGKTMPEFLDWLVLNTIHGMKHFDIENADNAFYVEMRDFYVKHSDEFPNWREKWVDYNKEFKFKE